MNVERFADSSTRALLKKNKTKLVFKEGWFWRFLSWCLFVVSFGQNKNFLTGFITTIGPVIGIPVSWKGLYIQGPMKVTIEHELVHVNQFKWAGLGSRWLGILPMFLVYVLLPFPVFISFPRWLLERPAYLVNLRYAKTISEGYYQYSRDRFVDNLTSSAYMWTFPSFVFIKRYMRSWFDKNV